MLGGAIATAIYTAILSNKFGEAIVDKIGDVAERFHISAAAETALLAAAETNTAAAYAQVPDITDEIIDASQMAVKLSYVEAFKMVYLVSIAFGGVAIIAAFSTKNTDSAKKTNQRAVVLKNEVDAMDRNARKTEGV